MTTETIPSLLSQAASVKPMSEVEYRAFVLKTQIYPTILRWGFEEQFHHPVDLDAAQTRILEQVSSKLRRKGAIIALLGERGRGKTTIAAQLAIAQAWKNHGEAMKESGPRKIEHFVYRKCAKIVARYKPLFADFGTTETGSLLESLENLCRNQEFLVIDEIFDCEDMKFKRMVLTDLIDRRYANCRDTILISNQSAVEFQKTIGDSILSRLGQFGSIIECKWKSYRTPQ